MDRMPFLPDQFKWLFGIHRGVMVESVEPRPVSSVIRPLLPPRPSF